ncbi:MAG TPA: xanthine dehydrogenase family protein molybdopterin-binding subunit [Bryobacteraceae bacterium]|nr:xanthine dehydrogenase family protein molybdopterin-binding subunit [Bryobacteraceae bacterium]
MSWNLPPWGETRVVGKALPRVDAYERVSGSAVYGIDLSLPGMLHAAVLRCPHGQAQVKSVDASRAEKMPGVRAVLTPASKEAAIPWYGGTSRLLDPHCRYAGEEVAVVAADTLDQAREALASIRVEYQVLPFVLEIGDAVKPGAPAVHEKGNYLEPPSQYKRGDIAKGFAEADAVAENSFTTGCELHTSLETHGAVAQWEGDRLTVWESTQSAFDAQPMLAGVFNLPLSSVRVICRYMGGGFGGKTEVYKPTVMAALLARMTGRPVKFFLSREEELVAAGNRPAAEMKLKAGVRKDGTLTAFEMFARGSIGAYPDGADHGSQVRELYRCANVAIDNADVFINAGRSCAFRAPGCPPSAFALEQTIDELAAKIGMDPVELRLKNITTFSESYQRPYTTTGLRECLIEGSQAFGWKEAREKPRGSGAIRRGVGVAAGLWLGSGEPNATVVVKLYPDGSANLNMGSTDLGTGAKTIMAMVVAEELGVPMNRIQVENCDTATTQYGPGAWGSQTALVVSPAVRAAAVEVRRQLLEIAAAEMKVPAAELSLQDGKIVPAGAPAKAIPLSDLKGLGQRRVLAAVGTRHPHPEDKVALPFGVHFAEVEVNTRTGAVRVLRLLAAQDSGRVLNRLTYENQVHGGVTQGLGYGLTEQRRLDRRTGRVLNANLYDYKIPTALDAPGEFTCLPIDLHDTECNTTGVKGLGEPSTIPTSAAIANAVFHATGVRVTHAPITPMQMLAALAEHRKRS